MDVVPCCPARASAAFRPAWQPVDMYIPRAFRVDDDTAQTLLLDVTVGQLITATAEGPLATFVPWVVDLDAGCLLGHVARANPQWSTPAIGQALVIAQGPDGYVSPSWYASKAEHGRVVPTWNYVVVHVYGTLVVHDDDVWVGNVVRRLTDRHETGRDAPWSVDDAPEDYVAAQLRAIVGIELRIERVEVSVKMSQNKTDLDLSGVISGFTADGNATVAGLVRRPPSTQ